MKNIEHETETWRYLDTWMLGYMDIDLEICGYRTKNKEIFK